MNVRHSPGHFLPQTYPPHNLPPVLLNRSTSINFVHVNGRSLYTVDRQMVVEHGGREEMFHAM